MQQPVGKDMSAIRVGAKLDFIDGHEIRPKIKRHRLNRANPIGRAIRHNPFFAGDQRHNGRPAEGDDPVIDLARQKPQRKPDHTGPMRQHALNREMGFAGIGGAKNRANRHIWIFKHGAGPEKPEARQNISSDRVQSRNASDVAPGHLCFKAIYGLVNDFSMRVQPLRLSKHVQSVLFLTPLFQDDAQPRHGFEMIGVKRQRPGNIRKGQAIFLDLEKRRRPGIPAFGKIRCMIGERGKMLYRGACFILGQGIAATFQQQIHRPRAGFGPFIDDPLFDSFPILGIRRGQFRQKFGDTVIA